MLTEDEKSLVRKAFSQGPAALIDAGFDAESARTFLEREDVQAALHLLDREFKNQEAIYGRTRFIAKRQLARITPGAVAVLGQAVAGPLYARDNQGNILMDYKGRPILQQPEPSPVQLRAAEDILDRIGVEGKTAVDKSADVNVTDLLKDADAKLIDVDADPDAKSHEERALSRERMRTAMEQLRQMIPEAREALMQKLLPGKTNGKAEKKGKKTAKGGGKKA